MAKWTSKKVSASELNDGEEYSLDDAVAIEELNAIVNNSLYASDKVDTVIGDAEAVVTQGKTELNKIVNDAETLVEKANASINSVVGTANEALFKVEQVLKNEGYWGSNPNLLINGDFRVNQRGLTTYTVHSEFTVDAWKLTYGSLAVNSDGSVTHTSTNTWQGIRQFITNPSRLAGKTITLSVNSSATTNKLAQLSVLKAGSSTATLLGSTDVHTGAGITSFTATIPSDITDNDQLYILLYTPQAKQSVTYYWTKLEVGSVATPFSPKPYEEELADCQCIEGGVVTTYSNPNLITNSDFRINQRGNTIYPNLVAGMYTVDCWNSSYQTATLEVLDKGVRLTSAEGNYGIFCQYVKSNIPAGTPLTLSVKVNGTIYSATGIAPDSSNSEYFCKSTYARVRWHKTLLAWQVEIMTGSGTSIDVEWIKFEIGYVRTPYVSLPYDEELAMCKTFWHAGVDMTTSNPNLLINGNFIVNQRGESEYNNTNAPNNKYTVDRWIHYINGDYTMTQNTNGGITVVNKSTTNVDFAQIIENGYELLNNKTVTVSTRVNGIFYCFSAKLTNDGAVKSISFWDNGTRIGTFAIQCMTNNFYKVYFQTVVGKTLVIDYIKLEVGSVATAFSPRPYAEELTLCQRYFRVLNDTVNNYRRISIGYAPTAKTARFIIPFNQMRTMPTVPLTPIPSGFTIYSPSVPLEYVDAVPSVDSIMLNFKIPDDNTTSLTVNQPILLYTASVGGTNGRIYLDAERY